MNKDLLSRDLIQYNSSKKFENIVVIVPAEQNSNVKN